MNLGYIQNTVCVRKSTSLIPTEIRRLRVLKEPVVNLALFFGKGDHDLLFSLLWEEKKGLTIDFFPLSTTKEEW